LWIPKARGIVICENPLPVESKMADSGPNWTYLNRCNSAGGLFDFTKIIEYMGARWDHRGGGIIIVEFVG